MLDGKKGETMRRLLRFLGTGRKAEKNALLLEAARAGDLDRVVAALDEGANVNTTDENDEEHTSLMLAAKEGHLELTELLLRKGANVNAMNALGWSALMLAAAEGHKDVVSTILIHRPDAIGEGGILAVSASTDAAQRGHAGIAALLLEARRNQGSMRALVEAFWSEWAEPEQRKVVIWVAEDEAEVSRKIQKDFPVYATALLVHEVPKQTDTAIQKLFEKRNFSVRTVSASRNDSKGGTDLSYLLYFQ